MCSGCHFIWAACKNRTIAMVSKEHYLDDFNPYSSSSTTVLTSRAPDWAATCMDGQPCAHMKHVAAAEYIARAERYVEMMGDGSLVRRINSTEYSACLPHAHGVACCSTRPGCWL